MSEAIGDGVQGVDNPAKWFVIRSNQRQEKLASQALRADHVEAFLPMIVQKDGRGGLAGAPMFPSYLFVRHARGLTREVSVSVRGVHAVWVALPVGRG
jgi:hypothetical protein